MDALLFTGLGLIVPAQVSAQLFKMIPDSVAKNADGTTSQPVAWLVKTASVVGPSLAVRKFVSQRAGDYMLIAGLAALALDAVRTFAPGVLPAIPGTVGFQPLLGEYYGGNPGLGAYFTGNGQGAPRGSTGLTRILANTPDRLDPAGRF